MNERVIKIMYKNESEGRLYAVYNGGVDDENLITLDDAKSFARELGLELYIVNADELEENKKEL